LDDGPPVLLERSVTATSQGLGRDGLAYRRLVQPLVEGWDTISHDLLGPLPLPPRNPLALARFGVRALRPARSLAERTFQGERARALFAGLAAHSIQPLERPATAAFGLVLGAIAHRVGWPMARGGSQQLAVAMAVHLRSLGGEIVTGFEVRDLAQLPPATSVFLDLTPRQVLDIASDGLPSGYRSALSRYRYGPGVFKLDWALDGPIPWHRSECARAGTVHLGGDLPAIAAAERAVWQGKIPERPYIIVVQHSLFDGSRAPRGKHTAWAYCHVPNGSTVDMTKRIEGQVERLAPGFGDLLLARSTMGPADMERYNPNYVGGDINGGVQDLAQLYTRPAPRLRPHATPLKGVYLCSSATPPGGGVHGMCGYHAARLALRRELG
jgi:phytoene dehydrogenase-like protein